MKSRPLHAAFAVLLAGSFVVAARGQDQPKGGDVVHAVAGTVKKVDAAGKTIAIKTADGVEHVFKYSDKTVMQAAKETEKGAKAGTVDTYMAGKEGTQVVVHYTEKGGEKTATGIDDFGKTTVKESKGTVTHVDKAARTVTVKAADGTEGTYHVAKDATIDTEHGVVKGSEWSAKEGDKVTVHYTEDAGKKVVHLFRRLW
jgi:hypothetical protein